MSDWINEALCRIYKERIISLENKLIENGKALDEEWRLLRKRVARLGDRFERHRHLFDNMGE